MKKINLHKFYYKDYFDLDKQRRSNEKSKFEYIFEPNPKGHKSLTAMQNRILTGSSFSDDNHIPFIIENPAANRNDSISNFIVAYPGLVTGIGINHEAKIEGEFKLGVHFDYTYGMPVVYGSSVKGVLRAYFKDFYQGVCDATDLLHDIFCGETRDEAMEKKMYKDCWEEKVKLEKNRKYLPKSIYNRDIFFDAVITHADKKGRILCSDSITPHGDNPLKNPTPLTFLKIAPGCTMEFRFKLVNSNIDGKVFTAAQKTALFEEIIKTVGIGAKTNVGYGQFQ